MSIRSLIVPPGIPYFGNRARRVYEGLHVLKGKVWLGYNTKDPTPISRVEISLDGGRTVLGLAKLHPKVGQPYAWIDWTFFWEAKEGKYLLSSRAFDSKGKGQPLMSENFWNFLGMANNSVQLIEVIVTKPDPIIQANWNPDGVVVPPRLAKL